VPYNRPAGEAPRNHRTLHSDPRIEAPVGPQWIHEIKHDGYRLIARKRDGRVRLFTRRGPSATRASAPP
jgi:ATP-dependent DNA ligase